MEAQTRPGGEGARGYDLEGAGQYSDVRVRERIPDRYDSSLYLPFVLIRTERLVYAGDPPPNTQDYRGSWAKSGMFFILFFTSVLYYLS